MSNISLDLSNITFYVPYEEVTASCIDGLGNTGLLIIIINIIVFLILYFKTIKELNICYKKSFFLKFKRILFFTMVLLNGVLIYYLGIL